MASINKLSLRGVRAFSPEDDEQVVDFYFPITVLVGQNGCGKTTVVESLKYAISGSMPPGVKSGQAFVHDPRSMGSTAVKAGVKLKFTSRGGRSMVVVRSMELTQKKSKVTFKQLDGVLRTIDETGQKKSASSKCTELDKQIPSLLGVSKAILDYVLFCHQEEASWPLMEGAVLKKRFDDIFDSTRYTKALDIFRKTEKELLSKVKDIKAEIASFSSHKHAAEGYRKELREQEDLEEDLGNEKKEVLEEIADLDAEINRLKDICVQVTAANDELYSARQSLANKTMAINAKQNLVEDDLTASHSQEELVEMLQEFDEQTSEKKEQEAALANKFRQAQQDIEALTQKKLGLQSRVGEFEAKKQAHEARIENRKTVMEKLIQKYSVDLGFTLTNTQGSGTNTNTSFLAAGMASSQSVVSQDTALAELSAEDLASFFGALQEKEDDLKARLQDHRSASRSTEDSLSNDLVNLGGKQKALEEERMKVKREKDKVKQKLDEIRGNSQGVASRKYRPKEIEEAKARAKKYAEQLKDASSSKRREEIPAQIRQLDTKVEDIKRKIDDEKRVLESLRETADAQNAIAVLKEQCERDFENLEEAVREEASAFLRFGLPSKPLLPKDDSDNGESLITAVQGIVDEVSDKYTTEVDILEKEKNEANKRERAVSEKTALLTSAKLQLGTLMTKIDRLCGDNGSVSKVRKVVAKTLSFAEVEGKVFALDEKSPEKLAAFLDEQIELLEEKKPADLTQEMRKKLVKRMKGVGTAPVEDDDDPQDIFMMGGNKLQCPCCQRDFKQPYGLDRFKKMLKDFVARVSDSEGDGAQAEQPNGQQEKLEQWRKVVVNSTNDLRDYARFLDEAKQLEVEIQHLEAEGSKSQTSLKDQKDIVGDLQSEIDGLRDLLDACKRFSEDASRIASRKTEISQKRIDLSMNTPNSDRDLRTVERDMAQQMDEKDTLTSKINELNKEMTQLNSTITDLTNQLSSMESRAKSLEESYAAQQRAEESKKTLTEQERELNESFIQLGGDLNPIQGKIRTKEAERKRFRSHASDEEEKHASVVNEFTSDVKRFRDLTVQIDAWMQSDEPGQLDQVNEQFAELGTRADRRSKDLEKTRAELGKIQNLLKDQERSKTQLKYNLDLIAEKAALVHFVKEVALKEDAVESVPGGDTVDDSTEKADEQRRKLMETKAQIDGRRGEVVERIRSIKRKLSAPEYKDVDKQYKVAMIKEMTTQIAAEDLKKYQKALDQALLQYHSVKIGEVNKIIRELWMLTYKGEDISNIEIVSGQEAGARAQKSYNYRVVMTKGNTQLDMRGRCSAGQRVLASIVIRLALAETFGVNCGCIALDEPTVNLDYKNKKGLAVALAQIVATRAQQRNFQLLLITHDEDFVGMMKTELSSLTGFSMPEKYFEVCREQSADGRYYSKIHARDWEDL